MEPELVALLTETVLLAPFLGQDAYGALSYGPAVATPCRIERHFTRTATTAGPQLIEETRVYLNGDAVIEAKTRVTFPDGLQPPIQGIKPVQDEYGARHHYEIVF